MGGDMTSKKKLERRKRYYLEKEYASALKRGPVTDPDVASRQLKFCIKIIKEMLDDEACLSFSKPVTELWDIDELPGYFTKVKRPMDLGTILENLSQDEFINKETQLFDFTLLIADVHLVFENCLSYNSPGTDLAKLGKRLMAQFDKQIREIPLQRSSQDKSDDADTPKGDRVDSESEDEKKTPEGKRDADMSGSEDEESDEEESPRKRSVDEGDEDGEDEEAMERLVKKMNILKKAKSRSEGVLAEIEMELNAPMSPEERMGLRDQVESAPWEKVDKVVQILQKYVDKAVTELGKDADPEFVTLELNEVEPHLLREVESIVRPDPRREKEAKKIEKFDADMEVVNQKMRSLKRSGAPLSSRRKQKRRR